MADATLDPVAAEVGPVRADLGMIVARAAERFGPKAALVAGQRTLTYQALHDLCDRVAGGLRELGVRPGDRVSLYSPNRWEWVVAYHAALRAGAVVNPVNVMLTPEEVAFVLNDCGAAAIFTAGEKAEVMAGLPRAGPTLRRVIPKARCSPIGPFSSTPRRCSRSRRGPRTTSCSTPCRCRTSTATS